MTQSQSRLHVRILIDNHRERAGQEILLVIVRWLVRYPGGEVLGIKWLRGLFNPCGASAAVIDASKSVERIASETAYRTKLRCREPRISTT